MPDVTFKISADAQNAVQGFNATQASMNKAAKELVNFGKQLDNVSEKKFANVEDQVKASLEASKKFNDQLAKIKIGLENIGEAAITSGKAGGKLQAQLEALTKMQESLNRRGINTESDDRAYNYLEIIKKRVASLIESKKAIEEENFLKAETIRLNKEWADSESQLSLLIDQTGEKKRLDEIVAEQEILMENLKHQNKVEEDIASFNDVLYGTQAQKDRDELIARQQILYDQLKLEADEKLRIEAFNKVLYGTEAQKDIDELIVKQQELFDQAKTAYEEELRDKKLSLEYEQQYLDTVERIEKAEKDRAEWSRKQSEYDKAQAEHAQKQQMYESLFNSPSIQIKDSISAWASKFGSTLKNIIMFRSVMTLTNGVVRAFKKELSESIKTAAEAEQVYSKLTTVFGEYAGAMERASDISERIGVSTQTAASALSTVGDLLQAQGANTAQSLQLATEWVEKFQDIIAFKDINMSLEEFAQNFMSGAAGNLRNFRQFGSIVKESAVNARLMAQGLDKLTGSELELAKMTARAEIALEQQKNAIGATEREWDTLLSIQRRFTEEQKSFRENFGELLEPTVKWWTKLATGIYDALNAQMEYDKYMKGQNGTSEKAVDKTATDRQIWDNKLSAFFSNKAENMLNIDLVKDLMNTISYYGIDDTRMKDIYETYAKRGDADGRKWAAVEKIMSVRQSMIKNNANSSAISMDMEALVDSADRLFEALQAIEGVNFHNSDWYKTISKDMLDATSGNTLTTSWIDSFSSDIADAYVLAMNDALSDINNIEDPLGFMFGDSDKGSIAQKKADLFKELYTVLYNSGMSETFLKPIKDAWDNATDAVKDYNNQVELTKKVTDQITAGFDGGAGENLAFEKNVDSLMTSRGWSEEYARAYQTAEDLYETTYAQAKLIEDENDRDAAMSSARQKWVEDSAKIAEYYGYIAEKAEKTRKEQELLSKQTEMKSLIDAQQGVTKDYSTQIRQLRMTDYEKTIDDFTTKMNEALTDRNFGLYWAIYESREEFEKLTEEQKKYEHELSVSQAWDGIKERAIGYGGKLGSAINTFTDNEGDTWTDIITVVMDLLEQAEGFSELLEAIDSFLAPIMYWLGDVVHMLGTVLVPILNALQPAIKGIAIGLTFLSGAIDMLFGAIYDLVENLSHPFKKWNWDRTVDAWDSMNSALDKICNATVSIEKSVSKDYGTYSQLYRNGMLSKDDYYSLIGANKYSSSSTISGGTLTNNGYGQHYLSVSGCTFKLEFDGSIEDFIKKLQEYEKGNGGYAVGLS